MTPTPTQALEPVEVTQADRDAAQAYLDDPKHNISRFTTRRILDEAFARHRQSSNAASVGVDERALQVADTIIPDTANANSSPIQRQAYWHVAHNAAKLALNPAFTAEAIERATTETKRLQHELDVTNADHVAVWIDANTIPDEPMSQCASWLAVQIVEAHERALASLSTPSPRTEDGWLPIDTAPRDGTWFIADGGGCERPTPMKWNNRIGAWECDAVMLEDWGDQVDGYSRPERWRPIPAAAKEGNHSA